MSQSISETADRFGLSYNLGTAYGRHFVAFATAAAAAVFCLKYHSRLRLEAARGSIVAADSRCRSGCGPVGTVGPKETQTPKFSHRNAHFGSYFTWTCPDSTAVDILNFVARGSIVAADLLRILRRP